METLRVRLARWWILAGRCLLAVSAGGYCFLMFGAHAFPILDWLSYAVLAVLAVTVSVLPLLVLPVASPATCVSDGRVLSASTVLGRRRVSSPRVSLTGSMDPLGHLVRQGCARIPDRDRFFDVGRGWIQS